MQPIPATAEFNHPFQTVESDTDYHGISDKLVEDIIGTYLVEQYLHQDEPVEEPTFKDRAKDVLDTAREEFSSDPNKVRSLAWGTLAVGSQVLDRARVSIVLVPEIATQVMEHTQNSILTGGATGGAIFLWCGAVGGVFGHALHKFPKSVSKFTDSFPGFVDTFSDSLAGVENKRNALDPSSAKNELQPNTPVEEQQDKGLEERIRINVKQATTTIGIGSTIFVGTATANGYSPSETSRMNIKVSGNAGVLGAVLGLTISETLMQLAENGHLDLANNIQNNFVGNRYVWLGLAALSMTSEFVQSRLRKRKSNNVEAARVES